MKRKSTYLLIIAGFFAFFFFMFSFQKVHAQVCNPSVRVDRYKCGGDPISGCFASTDGVGTATCPVNGNPTCQAQFGVCSSNDIGKCGRVGNGCWWMSPCSLPHCGAASDPDVDEPPPAAGSCSGFCVGGSGDCGARAGAQSASGSCTNPGDLCCTYNSGGGGCGVENSVCSGWADTGCCGGLTCNQYPGNSQYRCGDCTSPEIIEKWCGVGGADACGQAYICNNANFTCPVTQRDAIPGPPTLRLPPNDPTGITPITLLPTCNQSCTDSVDCGANWVMGRHNELGAPATYNRMVVDAATVGVNTYQEDNSRFRYYPDFNILTNAQFMGGNAVSTLNDGAFFWFPTTAASIGIISATQPNNSRMDIFVNGVLDPAQSITLNAPNPPNPQYTRTTVPINFGVAKDFICRAVSATENRCRREANPNSPICEDVSAPGVPHPEKSVVLTWANSRYDRYDVEICPQGINCVTRRVTQENYRLVPQTGITFYTWRVRRINDLCLDHNRPIRDGQWSAYWTFYIGQTTSPISSNVQLNLTGDAVEGVGPNGVCSSATATAYTGGGTVNVRNSSGTSVGTGTVDAAGSYTVNAIPDGVGYEIAFTPTDATYTCTCPAGCRYVTKNIPGIPANNFRFFVTQTQSAWYQVVGGDVGALASAGNSVVDLIPTTSCVAPLCSPYLIIPRTSDLPTGSLVMNRTANADLKSGNVGLQTDNVGPVGSSRLARLTEVPACRENYEYFYRLYSLGQNPSEDFVVGPGGNNPANATLPNGNPSGGKSAFFHQGNLTIGNTWNLNGNRSIVIFVNGNLNINSTIDVSTQSFLSFIVSGNITIGSNVGTATRTSTTPGQVEGMYIANGRIQIQGLPAPASDLKFIGEGTFAACGGVQVQRDFRSTDNNTLPAALFIYRPDLVRNTPDRMRVPLILWEEVSP